MKMECVSSSPNEQDMVASSVIKTEEETQRAAAEVQLQKYGKFFEHYTDSLHKIEETLQPYSPSPNNSTILLHFEPEEQASALDIISCNNKIIEKILTVFSSLCSEVTYIECEATEKYVDAILYYGEGLKENTPYEDCQLSVSQLLPLLQNLSSFVKHCENVILEILWQLSTFYELKLEVSKVNLYDVFNSLGDILITLLVIQEITCNNDTLIYHWSLYRKTIQLASHSASEFSYSASKIKQLDKLVDELETQLLSKKIFENVLSLPFDKKWPVKKNKKLAEEFNFYLKNVVSDLDKTKHENVYSMEKWAKVCVTFALYINLFGSYDKKFLKRLSDSIKKIPIITLHANVTFRINSFLLTYTGHLLKSNEKKLFLKDNNSQQYLAEATQKMNKDVPYYAMQVLSWVLQMEQKLKQDINNLKTDYMKDICFLLFEGIHYSSCIKMVLETISNLYITLKKPIAKSSAVSFCKLVEVLKCIEFTYSRHHIILSKLMNYAIQYTEHECLQIINQIKTKISKDKRVKEEQVDTVSSLVIAEDSLNGPTTKLRLLVSRLCLNLAGQMQSLNDPEHQKLPKILDQLAVISSLQQKVDSMSECSFMYWNKGTVPIYFEEVNIKQQNTNHTEYLIHALLNGDPNSHSFPKGYSMHKEIINHISEQIINPICHKIEENLRLHTLQHLQLNCQTLQEQNFKLSNFQTIRPICFDNKYVDLKWKMENYLDRTFYDLTTVALHDWQIYGEMRTLANLKFKLQTIDDNLPNQSLEQGLDLLEILRNVDTFVSNYFYNLNNQIFIEISSNNKYLNTINIRHIANSIRTHGAGIMSTAVNYTYQFLQTKLNSFSQFLYDEQIKSRLLREITMIKDLTEQLNHKYSFERAERLNKEIRKLGVTSDGLTYLDQFRVLITQIGNALGYVRMIRSGGLHCCFNVTQFVPNLKNIPNFESICQGDNLSEACCKSARCLDNVLNNATNNTTDGTNYFKLLVDVFSPVLHNSKNIHLRNFYMIVPSLTINFIEYIITAKETAVKKNKMSASFTDDGFAMGIAYILQALNLYPQFDSLHWFQVVRERNTTTLGKLQSQISSSSKDNTNLQHTLNLSIKRLRVYEREFTLLYYNLYSARVLFENPQRNDEDDDDDDEKRYETKRNEQSDKNNDYIQ